MKLDQALVDAAVRLMKSRFPAGPGGAAAMYLEDGTIVTSVSPDVLNESVSVCHETGAWCEASKLGRRITATVCVSRESERHPHLILPPCGVCQERLLAHGPDVEAAVPDPADTSKWVARTLRDLQPYYWRNALP
ncbi:MAG: cytidine deaminase [Planctomycetales bacterium]|nr:cytidine deaminase [Planctomycetales bacterium]